MKDIKELKIGKAIVTKNTSVSDLLQYEEFRSSDLPDLDVTIVRSKPNIVNFLGGNYTVEFSFDSGKLNKIELRPRFEGLTWDDITPEELELKFHNYNCKLLKATYGDPDDESDTGILYESADFKISSFRHIDMRDQNISGYVLIRVNKE